jgi:hypothetical protein
VFVPIKKDYHSGDLLQQKNAQNKNIFSTGFVDAGIQISG